MATEESKLLDDDRERRDSDDSSLSEDEAEKGIRRVTNSLNKNANDPRYWIRMKDKLIFMLGLSNVVILAVGTFDTNFHWFLPQEKMELFMLDFCYYANLALLFYLWVMPGEPRLFAMVFSLSAAPLAIAIGLYRNSLVLHDLDKTTSLFIHASPLLVVYVIRFFPKDTSRYWYTEFNPCLHGQDASGMCNVEWSLGTMVYTCLVPWCYFMLHATLYYVILQLCPCTEHIRQDKNYMTSYRYLTSKRGSLTYKIVNCAGPKWRVAVYGLCNNTITFVILLPVIVWYNNLYLMTLFIVVLLNLATWNGASFYMEVFSRRYDGVQHCAHDTPGKEV